MRAIYIRDDLSPSIDGILSFSDDRSHHLIKSVRVKKGDEVLLLDGKGGRYTSEVINCTKREVSLKVLAFEKIEKFTHIDLAIGLPKREAFESSLKNATQVGISEIYPFQADYSNWSIKNLDRVNSVIESSLIQSNNPYFPVVHHETASLDALFEIFHQYDYIFLTTLSRSNGMDIESIDSIKDKRILIIIGPEGGLSSREEELMLKENNVMGLKLATPILKTESAVLTIVGYVLGKFDVK
ncbi:RNA methyltransferase, RsmE family [Bacteriovorax sp. BAL6_X]|uniref:RsmE family RNA methyltransferase n=1 Tax=Bacteriovorax sp. BAL6_X TaxID=1201290 RepID=UPI000386DDB5|nr:16S rRNA (uracil(1498)-N(3))-methyltransferase [Bacteriovorax sp. BAL6_X]EPZ50434.1 RNA methyltransferase, RsmE family [Bacteriovorax sp. BAL6_X]